MRLGIIAFFLLLCSSFCISNDSIKVLSLEECRRLALATNEDMKIAHMTREKVEAEKNAAIGSFLPKIEANAAVASFFYNYQTTGFVNPIELSAKAAYMANISIQQPIFTGAYIAGTSMIGHARGLADENINLKQSEVILDADKMYWLHVSVREKVRLVAVYEKLLEQVMQLVTNVADVEMISQNEVMKVKVQMNRIALEKQRAMNGLELSRMALCKTIGVDYETKIVPSDTLVAVEPILYEEPENSVERRAEYKLMHHLIGMKEGETKLTIGKYLPTLSIGAAYGYAGGVKNNNISLSPANLSNVNATLNIPISQWFEGAYKIKSAKIDKVISEIEAEKYTKLMMLEIKQATLNVDDAIKRITMCESALEQAKENLRIATDRYEIELETLVNLLAAQSQWQTAYSDLIDARIDYRIKVSEFQKAVGELK